MNKPSGWMDEGHTPPMAEVLIPNAGPGPSIRGTYPVISWVQARNWREIIHSDQTAGYAHLPCPVECSASTFVLRVRGISMLPKFEDGDLIFVGASNVTVTLSLVDPMGPLFAGPASANRGSAVRIFTSKSAALLITLRTSIFIPPSTPNLGLLNGALETVPSVGSTIATI